MDDISLWAREVSDAAAGLAGRFVDYLPTLIGAILILLAGWVIARLLRAVSTRVLRWFNVFLDRQFNADRARQLQLSNTGVRLAGNVVFWVVILFFVTAATRVLGLDAFSAWLDRLVAYLPTLLAGVLIILVGFLVSALAHDLVSATAASAGVTRAEIFGRAAQGAILITALVVGIDQVGVDVTLLVTLIAILVASAAGSLTLAFALGARSFVGNLIGAHYVQQTYQPGQQVRMGGVEGQILEVTPVSVVLATEQGRVSIPASVFSDEATTLLTKAAGHD